jgi:nucleoside-diphosphate-sugar epimerase
VTLGEFSQMIGRAMGRRHTIVLPVPSPVTWSIAAVLELFSRLARRPVSLNLDKAREATAGSWTCSSGKAAAELGFQPAAPLQQRIEQTVQWYRDAKWI